VYLTLERPFLKRLQSLNRFWGLVAKVWLFQMVCLSMGAVPLVELDGRHGDAAGTGAGRGLRAVRTQAALALLCGFAMQFLDADARSDWSGGSTRCRRGFRG
jgi:hypothetical protein